jgi:argininosuccinate lyase
LAVKFAVKRGCDLADLPFNELQKFSNEIDKDVFAVLTLEGSIASRNHVGGTAPKQVKLAISRARKFIK